MRVQAADINMDGGDRDALAEIVAEYIRQNPSMIRLYSGAKGYISIRIGILLHRALTGALPGEEVDHHNGDAGDNRQVNLRRGTPSRNRSNQSPFKPGGRSASRFRGVCLHQSRKGDSTTRWRAGIKVDKQHIHIGYFKCEVEAARAFDAVALQHHGPEYRWFNFPDDLGRHMAGQHPEYAAAAN